MNDDGAVGDADRLKTLLFPLFVPVAVVGLAHLVGDSDALEGEVGNGFSECRLVEQCLLHIALDACFGLLERLEASFSGHRRQYVGGIAVEGCHGEFYLVIFHIGC